MHAIFFTFWGGSNHFLRKLQNLLLPYKWPRKVLKFSTKSSKGGGGGRGVKRSLTTNDGQLEKGAWGQYPVESRRWCRANFCPDKVMNGAFHLCWPPVPKYYCGEVWRRANSVGGKQGERKKLGQEVKRRQCPYNDLCRHMCNNVLMMICEQNYNNVLTMMCITQTFGGKTFQILSHS